MQDYIHRFELLLSEYAKQNQKNNLIIKKALLIYFEALGNENEKKFSKVRLYGEKLRIVNAPSKKGAKKITKNLLLSKFVKLNLKSFFQA